MRADSVRCWVQDEMTDEDFEKSVEELAKNKLQKPKKLSTYASRWLPEVLLARGCWDRVEQEVAQLRQLRRADVLAFVDAVLMPAGGSCRTLCVHVRGAAELARGTGGAPAENGAAENGAAVEGGGGEAGEGAAERGKEAAAAETAAAEAAAAEAVAAEGGVVVQAEGLAAFRMSQQLWPAARQAW